METGVVKEEGATKIDFRTKEESKKHAKLIMMLFGLVLWLSVVYGSRSALAGSKLNWTI